MNGPDEDDREAERGRSRAVMQAAGLGSTFGVAMGGLAYIGYRLDDKFDTSPVFIACGAFLGFGYGMYEVWKLVR